MPTCAPGLGSPPCPTAPSSRKLGGHPHCIARLALIIEASGRHARGSTLGWRQGGNRDQVAEVWAPGRNVGRKYAATLKRLGQPRQSGLSMPERVRDLGAVERAHSSIKLCAASLFEICSTGVEVAQNLAIKDENRGWRNPCNALPRRPTGPDDSASPTATEGDGDRCRWGWGVRGRLDSDARAVGGLG